MLFSLCFMGPLFAQQARQDSVDFAEIIEFAKFANAAYLSEADIKKLIDSGNYRLTHYRTIPESQVSYFIATNIVNKTQLIAVRGTSNVENTIVDISLKLRLDQHTGLKLHNGFSWAANQVYADLKPFLNKNYIINTTGHSLGGAVALILAIYLDVDQFTIGQVTTFGQPKVTNIAGTKQFNRLNILRVVTPQDLVPLVPLFDPLDINNLDIYWHSGKEILLLADTEFAILEGISSMLRATRFTQQRLNEDNLKHHQMSVYLDKLNKKELSSQLVPYKSSLNLFNLFGAE